MSPEDPRAMGAAPRGGFSGPPGLSAAEVQARAAAGAVNTTRERGARPLGQIIRSNTMTVFNLVIGVMWLLMLFTAPIQDALFGFVIVINSGIGIVQEYRASRTLAKLSVLGAARPLVVRDGTPVEIASETIVVDDTILLRPGDQILVDGPVLESQGMAVDESLLTGEADPVTKAVGEQVLSGSFVVAGSGAMRAQQVGDASYAAGLAAQARVYTATRSELMRSIMRFVRIMTYVLLPVAATLFISQIRASPDISEAISGTIAGVVTMIPEGLVLLTSVAMAVAVVRLGRAKALVQELPAVEVLARVDVLCVDKTGTLTEPGMALRRVIPLIDDVDLPAVLGGLGAAERVANPTVSAIAAAYPAEPGVSAAAVVPFSSARKWSAVDLAGPSLGDSAGWWILGAAQMVCAHSPDSCAEALERASALSATGARVLLLARPETAPADDRPVPAVRPVALLSIDQVLRHDAPATVSYFADQGVALKVISGDDPATVAVIASQAGVVGASEPVDARTLPGDPAGLAEAMERTSVFGRVTPAQKRQMVDALQSRGHVVAMTGDGVNDVLALKGADLGIAMGSGSAATRTAAQIVLLDNRFATMPAVVAEGRRVLGNIERVSDLFLTKSFYATTLAVLTTVLTLQFPLLPRHSTLINALTIGIPAFFLALMPNTARFRPGFLRRVLTVTIPSGLICGLAVMASYGLSLLGSRAAVASGAVEAARATGEARTAATITLFLAAWWVLVLVARPLNPLRWAIVLAMAGAFAAVLAIPPISQFLALSLGPDRDGVIAVGVGLLAMILITLTRRASQTGRVRLLLAAR